MLMTKDELMEVIKDNIKDYLPEHIANSCEVQIVEVTKNNDRVLKGFVFDRGENMPCPTFYIEDAYKHYLRGDTPQEIMEDLANAVEQSWDMKLPAIDMDMDYDNIKDHLGYQLVDAEHNRDRLNSCVNTKLGNDLAMIYYIEFEQEDGFARAVITNEMAESMGYDAEQIKKDAKVSMEKLHPPLLFSGREMAKKGPNSEIDNLLDYHDMVLDDKMYILTNEANRYGASSIMYDGLQEKLGNMVQGNYYVIPSSNVEVMIVPVKGGPDAREIINTIREANEIFVDPEQFLSNRLFMYDRGEKMLAEVKVPNRGRNVEWER